MTRDDAIKILSILKAAYPSSYKGMTKEEANGTISVWAAQFSTIPASVIYIAINKLIGTNQFPPTISEVKDKLHGMYYEAAGMLTEHKQSLEGYAGRQLDDQSLQIVNEIINATNSLRGQENNEPSISDLLHGGKSFLLAEKSGA